MKTSITLTDFYRLSCPRMASLVTAGNNIITIAWQTPLSKSPPLYGISVAPKRHSHGLIKSEKEFGVNFLTVDHLDGLKYCGSHSGKNVDKWAEAGFTKEKAEQIKQLLCARYGRFVLKHVLVKSGLLIRILAVAEFLSFSKGQIKICWKTCSELLLEVLVYY